MSDTLDMMVSGTVDRQDRCPSCREPMLYRLDSDHCLIEASFCGSAKCAAFLLEIPE